MTSRWPISTLALGCNAPLGLPPPVLDFFFRNSFGFASAEAKSVRFGLSASIVLSAVGSSGEFVFFLSVFGYLKDESGASRARITKMGARQSMKANIPPQNIAEFRKLASPEEQYIIPEVPEKRKVTDLKFVIFFAVCLALLVPFLIYTVVHADIDRLIHGYDPCGNVCGKKNDKAAEISCSGVDMTSKPLLKYEIKNRELRNNYLEKTYSNSAQKEVEVIPVECVGKCASNYFEIFNRCFPAKDKHEDMDTSSFSSFFSDVAHDLNRSAGYIVALCLIGLGFCIGMLLLFRYFVTAVVWVILVGSLLGIVALTCFLWYANSQIGEGNAVQVIAIFFTIICLVLVAVLICMFKRIQLLIRLFKEAIKVIFGIPLILCEPFLTFIASSILVVAFFYLLVLFNTSGFLEPVSYKLYEYSPNGAILFTIWFHVVICIWMAQFIVGCQHMVISGAVSSYYFARHKSELRNPIYNSFYNLIRYHLGTVAFGSLIITVIAIIKEMIRGLSNSKQVKLLIDCCLGTVEEFLKYLSKNAYIQTAMHGQPFFKSGKRAVRLLAANALSAIAINSVGDFVLFMAKLLIVVCTILVGVLMRDPSIPHFWAAIVISSLVTAIVADCFFLVFETAIDTIFLCYCEDNCMNDGETRPYYMPTEFMQYIEEAKKNAGDKQNA